MPGWLAAYRIWAALLLAGGLATVLVLQDRELAREREALSYAVTANGWYFAQMEFEMLRLSRALADLRHGDGDPGEVELRFEVAWSRAPVLAGSALGSHPRVRAFLTEFEALMAELEPLVPDVGRIPPSTLAAIGDRLDTLTIQLHRIWVEEYAATGYRNVALGLAPDHDGTPAHKIALAIIGMMCAAYLAYEAQHNARTARREAEARHMESRAREEEAAARRQAEAANAARGLFLANMSHELRTPLNGVLGMAEILAHTDLTDRQRAFVEVIQSSGKALTQFITDILDFSKIEAGNIDFAEEPFDAEAEAEQVIALLAPQAARKGLELVLRIAPSLPQRVLGDAARFRQVLMNLAANAIKFTDEGLVEVSLRWDEGALALRVDDTGPGVPEDMREAIFEAFRQAATPDKRPEGAGLGLAICRSVVLGLGGTIWVEPGPAGGSSFGVRLPAPMVEDAPGPVRGGLRVLLAEPRDATREAFAARLARHGHRVETAAAPDLAMAARSDIVLLSEAGLPAPAWPAGRGLPPVVLLTFLGAGSTEDERGADGLSRISAFAPARRLSSDLRRLAGLQPAPSSLAYLDAARAAAASSA